MAFTNKNICKNVELDTSAAEYFQLKTQECSEIVVVHTHPAGIYVSDGGGLGNGVANPTDVTSVLVPPNVPFTFTGITNSNDLSAKAHTSGAPKLYYQTRFFNGLPQR